MFPIEKNKNNNKIVFSLDGLDYLYECVNWPANYKMLDYPGLSHHAKSEEYDLH